jgi:pimeloyl-ACP methyl ester carboxylesterase
VATRAPDLRPPGQRFRAPDGAGLQVWLEDAVGVRSGAPVTVVLAHGWSLDSRIWSPVSAALRHSSGHAGALPAVRVLRYDLRGHGRSEPVPAASMTIETLADDLAALIEALVPDGPLVLAGHSMGGMTMLALAERQPDLVAARVGGLALVSTASGGLADGDLGAPRFARVYRAGERRLYASRLFTRRPQLSRFPRLVQPGLRWLLLGPGADRLAVQTTTACIAGCRVATIAGFRSSLDAHDRDKWLSAFSRVPTAVLVGSHDRLTPVKLARRMIAGLPAAELTVFPGAGHMLPLERVAGVAARIARLVQRC